MDRNQQTTEFESRSVVAQKLRFLVILYVQLIIRFELGAD